MIKQPLPIDIREKVGKLKPSLLGRLMYYLIPVRRGTVLSNMKLVFGDTLSPAEIRKLAQCFYGHILRVLGENLALGWMSDDEIRRRCPMIGAEVPLRFYREGKGMIFLSGHFGNWEMTPIGAILHYQEFRHHFFILRKTLVNKTVERLLFSRFYRVGLNIIPKGRTLNRVLEAIQGKNAVTFVMDQYARPGRDGIEAEFFGHPAGTFRSLALVAASTNVPVIPVVCYRDGQGRNVMRFFEPLKLLKDPDPDREIQKNTRLYNQILEGFVLDHPDQWLWMHKRWKKKHITSRRRKKEA